MIILMRTPKGRPTETTIIKTASRPTLFETDPGGACALIREELGQHLAGRNLEAGLGDLEDDDPDES